MSKTRRMTIGFFRPAFAEGFNLIEVFEEIMALPAADRAYHVDGVPYRLDRADINARAGIVDCDFVRVRLDFHPGRVRLDRDGVKDLNLDNGEYLGEETAFTYWKGLNVFGIHRNRNGASYTTIARYLQHFIGSRSALILQVMFDKETMKRLAEAEDFRTVFLEVAEASGRVYRELGATGTALARIQNEVQSPYVGVRVSMGHKRGSLEKRRVKDLVDRALDLAAGVGDRKDVVQTLKVVATFDGESKVIDLLNGKLSELMIFDSDDRRVPYPLRRAQIHRARDNRADDLEAYRE